mgnify:CR=1 FL=1
MTFSRDLEKSAKASTLNKIASYWAYGLAKELDIKSPKLQNQLRYKIRAAIIANNPKDSNGLVSHGTIQKYFHNGKYIAMPNVIRESIHNLDDICIDSMVKNINS